jgi:DNA modification methylase
MTMEINTWPLDRIKPYDGNPRKRSATAVAKVAASIREFGWRQPIVVDDDGVVLVGHTRLLAAHSLELENAPVHVARGLSDAQKRAYRIADNRTNEETDWAKDLLTVELSALKELTYDLSLTAFDLDDLLGYLPAIGLTDEDAVPEPMAHAASSSGDLWLLGDHRVLCGDASAQNDVDRLLEGGTVDLVNTDPPYNVRVEPRSNNAIAAGMSSFGDLHHHQIFDVERKASKAKGTTAKMRPKDRALENDFIKDDDYAALLRQWFGNLARVLKPGGSFYIWAGYSNVANYPKALAECGMRFAQLIIWVKDHPVLTRKDFMGNHEMSFYGWRDGAAHWFNPEITNATDVWIVKKINPNAMVHLTEKPVELAIRALTYSSKAGHKVLDLFGGSGSTLIAAEKTGRRARLMEIDPPYCDVIVQRWEQYTGKPATLDGDGRTFEEVREERHETRNAAGEESGGA